MWAAARVATKRTARQLAAHTIAGSAKEAVMRSCSSAPSTAAMPATSAMLATSATHCSATCAAT